MNALMSRPPGAQFKVKPQNLDWKCILFPIQVPKKPGVRQVRRCLKELGFVNRRVVKRPMLTKAHIKARNLFWRKYQKWTVEQWQNVKFSDEKMFRTRPGVLVRCWKQKSESKFEPRYVQTTVQKPLGLMVWVTIDGKGRLILRRCPPRLKAVDY